MYLLYVTSIVCTSGVHDIKMVLRCLKCLEDSNKAGKRAERHVLSTWLVESEEKETKR